MTPAQLDHLRAIDAHLAKLLDISAKRTPGEWKLSSHNTPVGETGDYEGVIQIEATTCRQSDPVLCEFWNPDDEEDANFQFIASCAGNAEAGWKATRAAIAAILNCRSCGGTGITSGWTPSYADPSNVTMALEAEPCCEHIKDILAAFPNV